MLAAIALQPKAPPTVNIPAAGFSYAACPPKSLHQGIIKILPFETDQKTIIIDLGAGSGIFLDRILSKQKNVKCYWVDYSEDYLTVARKRLSQYGRKVE